MVYKYKWKVFIPHKGWIEGTKTVFSTSYMKGYSKVFDKLKNKYKNERGANVFVVREQ